MVVNCGEYVGGLARVAQHVLELSSCDVLVWAGLYVQGSGARQSRRLVVIGAYYRMTAMREGEGLVLVGASLTYKRGGRCLLDWAGGCCSCSDVVVTAAALVMALTLQRLLLL